VIGFGFIRFSTSTMSSVSRASHLPPSAAGRAANAR